MPFVSGCRSAASRTLLEKVRLNKVRQALPTPDERRLIRERAGISQAVLAAVVGRARAPGLVALALALAATSVAWTIAAPSSCERESAYFCISVTEGRGGPDTRELRMDMLRHAYVDLKDPTHLEFAYTRLLGDVSDKILEDGVADVRLEQRLLDHAERIAHVRLGQLAATGERLERAC